MTAPRPTWTPIGPEYQMALPDWLNSKTALQPTPAGVGPGYQMAAGDGVT